MDKVRCGYNAVDDQVNMDRCMHGQMEWGMGAQPSFMSVFSDV